MDGMLLLAPAVRGFAASLGAAGLLGALIGLERQWHQGVAGLRTNAMVALAASAFVCIPSLLHEDGTGPAHMANFIVTGIGFLGGGVILRDGASVKGMNTAATLWGTGAVGALCGCGLWQEAVILATGMLVVNLAMRPVVSVLNRLIDRYGAGTPSAYRVEVTCDTASRDRIRALLSARVEASRLIRRGMESKESADTPGDVMFVLELGSYGGQDRPIETLVAAMWEEPGVSASKWSMANPDADPKMHVGS